MEEKISTTKQPSGPFVFKLSPFELSQKLIMNSILDELIELVTLTGRLVELADGMDLKSKLG